MAIQVLTNLELLAEPTDPEHVINVKYLEEHGSRRFAATFTGDGTETVWTIDHQFDTSDVVVAIYNATTHALVLADVVVTDDDTVTVTFAAAPATGSNYRAVVIG